MTQLRLGINQEPERAPIIGDRGPVARRSADVGEIVGHKGSIFYRAHSYHTKVPPEGIARLIEHYTDPGDVVVDPFCGSGMTGIACRLTGRHGVLSDLSPAAVHIASNYNACVDADSLAHAGQAILQRLRTLEESLYSITCRACHRDGLSQYTVWSDVYECPTCTDELVFWHGALDSERTRVQREVRCDRCAKAYPKRELTWRRTEPVHVSTSCDACRTRADGALCTSEVNQILERTRSDLPFWYPTTPFEESREMWRGQHRDQQIATAADFYTVRNLWALSAIWHEIGAWPDEAVRSALRFAFTAVVPRASRRYQWNPKRPTNVLTSTLYIASLSYEFNVFSLLRRKLKAVADLYRASSSLRGTADVHLTPAQNLAHLPDASADYVFTDPPFGSNIFYADASFLWEAWLDQYTDTAAEAVVNKSVPASAGGKTVDAYEKLMTGAFEEIARVLRPEGWASVMFHNSDDQIWSALQRAIDTSGFEVDTAVAFDKSQPSFKAVKGALTGERVPSFDLVLHLRRRVGPRSKTLVADGQTRRIILDRLTDHLEMAPKTRRTTPYLHSLVMRTLFEADVSLQGWTYSAVEDLCAKSFEREGRTWRTPNTGRKR